MIILYWIRGNGVYDVFHNTKALPRAATVVSYFEAGAILTLNHGHAALLAAFGALVVLGLRHVLTDEQGRRRKNSSRFLLGD
jgi:nitric oxide reductase large subunit